MNLGASASGPPVAVAMVDEPMNVVPFEPRRRRKILGLSPIALAGYAAAAAAATTVESSPRARCSFGPAAAGEARAERGAGGAARAVAASRGEPASGRGARGVRSEGVEDVYREARGARVVDPEGDTAPGVDALWKAASAGLEPVAPKGDDKKTRGSGR